MYENYETCIKRTYLTEATSRLAFFANVRVMKSVLSGTITMEYIMRFTDLTVISTYIHRRSLFDHLCYAIINYLISSDSYAASCVNTLAAV